MAAHARKSGDVLEGRYRLVDRLGQGGFGDVWRAEELLPDGSPLREVALKLLRAEIGENQDWTEEARIIASFRHPALVTIYAAGILQLDVPIPFVAMELLRGESLAEPVAQGRRVVWRRVVAWARQAAAALDEIHRAGVVHLDLKPANLFLTSEGDVKVLDFGIAQRGRARPQTPPRSAPSEAPADMLSTIDFMALQQREEVEAARTRELTGVVRDSGGTRTSASSRTVVGTPGFMAPEIFEGGEPTPASDAYALAACMVQLCTGGLPQRVPPRPAGEVALAVARAWVGEVQAATVRGELRDLSEDDAKLPPALVTVLRRWLSLDPAGRGTELGPLRAQLDEIWTCPHGWAGNPYRGLAPYRAEDEGKLPGRGEDAARLGRELGDQPALVLQGVRGVGLRSLAVAGVVPELARSFADDCDDWLPAVVELGAEPDADLDAALAEFEAALPNGDDAEPSTPDGALPSGDDEPSTPDGGAAPDGPFLPRIAACVRRTRRGVALVVVGLERLLDAPAEASSRLVALARELIRCRASRVAESGAHAAGPDERARCSGIRLLATLSEDRTVALLGHPVLGPELRPYLRFIGPPQPVAVREIVQVPMRASGVALEDPAAVVRELQNELVADGGRLPLVSLALAALWEAAAASDGPLATDAWAGVGGLAGISARHAEAVVSDFDAHDLRVAEAVLLRFVTSAGACIEVDEAALASAFDDVPAFASVLERLNAARVLVLERGDVRLCHPRLPELWRRLANLRLANVERLGFLEELREAARRWTDEGHPGAALWRGRRLHDLGRHVSDGDLSDEEAAFIRASRKAGRLRWLARGLVALAALGAIMGAAALEAAIRNRSEAQERARRQAEQGETLARLVARSRRSSDLYERVAYLSAAIGSGSTDPWLAYELLLDAQNLPPAQFLSLEHIPGASFPWGERWLVGGGGVAMTVFDFKPLEDTAWGPVLHRFRPHEQGMDDYVAFPFANAFVTRGLDGELRVWRLRPSGEIVLAAVAPMRCERGRDSLVVAAAAPVLACLTGDGIARWDLRTPAVVTRDAFDGRLLDLSPDGRWLAGARGATMLFWRPDDGARFEADVGDAPSVARFSPRDPAVALLGATRIEILRLRPDGPEKAWRARAPEEAYDLAWDPRGVDLGVCSIGMRARWYYLRRGARSPGDPPPDAEHWPCDPRGAGQPERLHAYEDYAPLTRGGRQLGKRKLEGGWRLSDGKVVTADLVVFDTKAELGNRLLEFRGADANGAPEPVALGESAVAVARLDDDQVAWQMGDELRLYKSTGERMQTFKATHLLAPCPDGRLLAWRKRDEATWEIVAARHDVLLRTVPREPAFFVGAEPSCHTVFLQRIDGQLVAVDVDRADDAPRTIETAGGFVLGGYAYDVRPSAGRGKLPPGLWVALGSGAILRLESDGDIRPEGHATPRATAMADGPAPGDLLFADDSGIVLRSPGAPDRILLDGASGVGWSDMVLLPDGKTLLLATDDTIAAVDVERHELVFERPVVVAGRLSRWDDEGSTLLWSFDYMGPAAGEIIPVGPSLAGAVAASVSNLRVVVRPDRGISVVVGP